ncbi:MAG: tRNA (adenosine(37)-N6)-dimethylallyltransferase MiaA [Acidobacteria bacterium]|nr:tRNA (adenosine(37)-N6)-dimethylallyltransferase MiaA [Acidobacteriota bacterium]
MTSTPYPLVSIVGPTATGKSELGIYLARRFSGQIINCDSMQVYRGLNVGTAKVPPAQRQVPHHLLDVADIHEYFSAGRFADLARQVMAGVRAAGDLPILVGGTGFYLRALLYGIFPGPGRQTELRQRFDRIRERRGLAVLHRILAGIDPQSAERISPRDYPRIARALEVYYATGIPMSRQFGRDETALTGFVTRMYCLHLPRPFLYDRINRRVEQMLARGWEDEVRGILAAGHPADAKGLEAIGYREIIACLTGTLTAAEAVERIQQKTRQFAKRQLTWFRKEKNLVWLEGAGDDPSIQTQVGEDVRTFLTATGFLS